MTKSLRNHGYYLKFPPGWVKTLRMELQKEFNGYPNRFSEAGEIQYLPPVVTKSKLGKFAGWLPSKPQGITIWGTIYYTPNYPVVLKSYKDGRGDAEALVYEFGMYAHETYHAIEQELTGKLRWFIKYIARLIKTPNAYRHPMEIPAYEFQDFLKRAARQSDENKS
jgi:hypothetical protein